MIKIRRLAFPFLILFAAVRHVNGYPFGPPAEACESLSPSHGGLDAMPAADNPYKITVDKTTAEPGETISVTLEKSAADAPPFRGFMIQARDGSGSVVGEFTELPGTIAKYLDCSGLSRATVVHTTRTDKDSVAFKWTMPEGETGEEGKAEVKFAYTVVQTFDKFWAAEESEAVTIEVKEDDGKEGGQSAAAAAPVLTRSAAPASGGAEDEPEEKEKAASEAEPEKQEDGEEKEEEKKEEKAESVAEAAAEAEASSEQYTGCLETKGCLGIASGCLESRDCAAFATYAPSQSAAGKYDFVLEASASEAENRYVALGISDDDDMGNDLVFACSQPEKGIHQSYNKAGAKANAPLSEAINVGDVKFMDKDGVLTCWFTLDAELSSKDLGENVTFDLASGKVHLLLASGNVAGEALTYHEARTATEDPVALTEFVAVKTSGGGHGQRLLKAHGVLCTVAWMAMAPVGMLFARYMKSSCGGKKICNRDVWFLVHQTHMLLAVLCTLAGFIVVAYEVGFLPYSTEMITDVSAHPAIGFAVLLLTLLQPMLALFRPTAKSSSRWLFNFGHWLLGTAALLLGLTCIFLAPDLPAAAVFIRRHEFHVLCVVYVAVLGITHLLLTALNYRVEGYQRRTGAIIEPAANATGDIVGPYTVENGRGKSAVFAAAPLPPIVSVSGRGGGKDPDSLGSFFRHCFAIFFVVFAYAMVIAIAVRIYDVVEIPYLDDTEK